MGLGPSGPRAEVDAAKIGVRATPIVKAHCLRANGKGQHSQMALALATLGIPLGSWNPRVHICIYGYMDPGFQDPVLQDPGLQDP